MHVWNMCGGMCTCGHRCPQNLEEDVGLLKLEWMLGTKPWTFTKAVSMPTTGPLSSLVDYF